MGGQRRPIRPGTREETPDGVSGRAAVPGAAGGGTGSIVLGDGRTPGARRQPGEARPRPESLGLVLLGLVGAIGLTLAIAVAFPAWNDLRQPADPTANPTNVVAIAEGTGTTATDPGPVAPRSPVPTRVRPTSTTPARTTGTGEDPDDTDAEARETPVEDEPTRTPVAAADATLRPAPPVYALDGRASRRRSRMVRPTGRKSR